MKQNSTQNMLDMMYEAYIFPEYIQKVFTGNDDVPEVDIERQLSNSRKCL